MNDISTFNLTPEHFGVFWKYINEPSVTDIDYNGSKIWITDFEKGRYTSEHRNRTHDKHMPFLPLPYYLI